MSDFQAGDRILAQWDGGRFWFPGTVHSVGEDDGIRENTVSGRCRSV